MITHSNGRYGTAAPIESLVDAFFAGVEDNKHYIHTHHEHSDIIFRSRVANILGTRVNRERERKSQIHSQRPQHLHVHVPVL